MKKRHEKKKYPCYNLSLVNLRDEQWADIPGFKSYYSVSNYGRVKRLNREQINSKGVLRKYAEKIIAPRIYNAPNNFVKDITSQLYCHLSFENKRHHLSIRRLVYQRFVAPFDYHDDTVQIVCKNGDGLDLRSSNLKMLSKKEAARRIIKQQRRLAVFKNPDPHKAGWISGQKTGKPMTQYNAKGKKIKTFPSGMEASRQTGISNSHIRNAANGIDPTAGGYFWQFGNAPVFDVESFLEERRIGYKEKKGQKVTQYDMDGNRVARYLTLVDAAKAIGKDSTGISANIRGITKQAYGFVWKKGYGKEKINLERQLYGNDLRAIKVRRKTRQYSLSGKYIKTFASVKEAAAAVKVASSTISGALSGKYTTAGGFIWK